MGKEWRTDWAELSGGRTVACCGEAIGIHPALDRPALRLRTVQSVHVPHLRAGRALVRHRLQHAAPLAGVGHEPRQSAALASCKGEVEMNMWRGVARLDLGLAVEHVQALSRVERRRRFRCHPPPPADLRRRCPAGSRTPWTPPAAHAAAGP